MTTSRTFVLCALVCLLGRPVAAQTVADVLTFLVTNQGVQTGSVERDRAAATATSTTISRALLANLATLPVASSSGSFVYRLNPELGTPQRITQSFGPFFVERAITAGRGQVSFGLTLQQMRFNSLDGRDLRDGSLVTTANQFTDESEPFDVDRLTLDINASVATLYANAGVTDRIEVGVAAPMVSLVMDGSRLNTYRGRQFTQATAEARATGFADLVVRTKVTAYREEGAAIAGAVDVRLPTGQSDNLLGTGSTSVKFSAIGSLEHGRLSSHANAGVTLGGLAQELSYAGAMALAASSRVTVIGEVIGRLIDSAGGVIAVSAPHPTLRGVETIRLTPSGSFLNSIVAAPGVKWNVTDTWVFAANVSIALTNDGLTSRFTPFVGLDYQIGR
jgi:Putative MetA-pathway of phenol degradation